MTRGTLTQVHAMLNGKMKPEDAHKALMGRPLGQEKQTK